MNCICIIIADMDYDKYIFKVTLYEDVTNTSKCTQNPKTNQLFSSDPKINVFKYEKFMKFMYVNLHI